MENFKQPARTVQEEMSRERKFWKQNQLWTLLLAGALLVFSLLGGSGASVAAGSAGLTLTMHDGSTATVYYEDITAVELLQDADYGTLLSGRETRTGKSGIWEHPLRGSYTLCVYSSCTDAVQITGEDGCYVVNMASEAETQQLYQLLVDKAPASR